MIQTKLPELDFAGVHTNGIKIRFSLKKLFLITAVLAVLLGLGAAIRRHWYNTQLVITRISALNGAVSVDFPGDGWVSFSLAGLSPLVRDADLKELSPYLAALRTRDVSLANTNISDEGFRSLAIACRNTLQAVDVTNTAITEDSLRLLPDCDNLKTISISRRMLDDSGVRLLASIASLRTVIIYEANPDDERVKLLAHALDGKASIETRARRHINE